MVRYHTSEEEYKGEDVLVRPPMVAPEIPPATILAWRKSSGVRVRT